MIKAVIFDYGGVLIVEENLGEFCKRFALKFDLDFEKFYEACLEVWNKARIDEIDSNLFWTEPAALFGFDPAVFKNEFHKSYLNEQMMELVRKVKQHYKIALLSDHIRVSLGERIKEYNFEELFDVIVTSYTAKKVKPNPEIYKETANELGVELSECVFIDDKQRNIPPANELGMKAILFKDVEQLTNELKNLEINME